MRGRETPGKNRNYDGGTVRVGYDNLTGAGQEQAPIRLHNPYQDLSIKETLGFGARIWPIRACKTSDRTAGALGSRAETRRHAVVRLNQRLALGARIPERVGAAANSLPPALIEDRI